MASVIRSRLSKAASSLARSVYSPRIFTKVLGLLIASTLLTFTSETEAQTYAALPVSIANLNTIGTARPVPAWNDFCHRHPSQCAVDVSQPSSIDLTPEIWKTIVRINLQVNAEIKPMTDQEQWGVVDSWDFPTTGYGDCEDYQLLKRKRLVAEGLPQRALRMTVVLDELNEGHAVLKIMTDRGDFVLDNKTNAILPWDRTGYTYIKREGHDSTTWVSLGGAIASPTAVATAER